MFFAKLTHLLTLFQNTICFLIVRLLLLLTYHMAVFPFEEFTKRL